MTFLSYWKTRNKNILIACHTTKLLQRVPAIAGPTEEASCFLITWNCYRRSNWSEPSRRAAYRSSLSYAFSGSTYFSWTNVSFVALSLSVRGGRVCFRRWLKVSSLKEAVQSIFPQQKKFTQREYYHLFVASVLEVSGILSGALSAKN